MRHAPEWLGKFGRITAVIAAVLKRTLPAL
jgi:hypothetical protein